VAFNPYGNAKDYPAVNQAGYPIRIQTADGQFILHHKLSSNQVLDRSSRREDLHQKNLQSAEADRPIVQLADVGYSWLM
jgi:hypothetical protein